ncbi:hypothetical protein FKM82_014079 [Ascaphus truei]
MKRLPTQHLDTCLFPCLLGLFSEVPAPLRHPLTSHLRGTHGDTWGTQGKGFSSAVRLDGAEGVVEEKRSGVAPTERQNRSWPWWIEQGVGYAKLGMPREHHWRGDRDISQETVLEIA